jgi:hypothetical protein
MNHTENEDFEFTTMSNVRAILEEYYEQLK